MPCIWPSALAATASPAPSDACGGLVKGSEFPQRPREVEMDSLLHFKPGDTWLLRGRGARDRNHLLAPATASRASAAPAISRWRGLETLPMHLLQMLREARANDAFARRLE